MQSKYFPGLYLNKFILASVQLNSQSYNFANKLSLQYIFYILGRINGIKSWKTPDVRYELSFIHLQTV